jgi:hypothetical protein
VTKTRQGGLWDSGTARCAVGTGCARDAALSMQLYSAPPARIAITHSYPVLWRCAFPLARAVRRRHMRLPCRPSVVLQLIIMPAAGTPQSLGYARDTRQRHVESRERAEVPCIARPTAMQACKSGVAAVRSSKRPPKHGACLWKRHWMQSDMPARQGQRAVSPAIQNPAAHHNAGTSASASI